MKYHYIYKITNEITQDYYIGAHSCNNLFDGYMGSGILIKRAIKYYGIENFSKVIIKNCKSAKDKWRWERKLLTKEIIINPKCYNLITGGKRRSKNSFKVSVKTKSDKNLWYK